VTQELTRAVRPLSPATVLRLLYGARPADGGTGPGVAVHLAGGPVLEGKLMHVGTDRGPEVAVLLDPRTGYLSYVDIASVVAVTVHAVERYRDMLTGGALPPASPDDPLVTRLMLRRSYPRTPEFPLELHWDGMPDDAAALTNLVRLLDSLREAVAGVRADEFGRTAWARVPEIAVGHRPGGALTVERRPDGGLSAHADLTAALPRNLTTEVARQLNAAL
jgi:hypothetical protein